MLSLQDGQSGHGPSVPHVDGWVPTDLSSGSVVLARMEGKAEDVVGVGGVELLRVCVVVVDYSQGSYVVDDVTILCVVEVATTVVATVTDGEGGGGGEKEREGYGGRRREEGREGGREGGKEGRREGGKEGGGRRKEGGGRAVS